MEVKRARNFENKFDMRKGTGDFFSLNFKFWLSFSVQIRILLQEINDFYKFIYEYDKTLVIHVLIIIIY